MQTLNFRPGTIGDRPGFALTPDSEERLQAWCSTFGVLGVLPHRTEALAVSLPPQEDEHGQVWLHENVYRWHAGQWHEFPQASGPWARDGDGKLYPVAPVHEADPPDPSAPRLADSVQRWSDYAVEMWAHHRQPWKGKPRALLTSLNGATFEEEPLTATWARFFPNAEKQAQLFPVPLWEAFWKNYAEPLEAFLEAAVTLQTVARDLDPPSPAGFARLQPLLDRLRLSVRDGGQPLRWASPSLFGTLAMMVAQDLQRGRRPAVCQVCANLFFANLDRARYCSERCRHTEQKRRWRGKRKRKAPRRSTSRNRST